MGWPEEKKKQYRESRKQSRTMAAASGYCGGCSKERPEPGMKTCRKCIERSKLSHEKHQYKHKYDGKYWSITARKSRYGITKEEFEEKLQKQNFQCGICQCKLYDNRYTHVDHCHITGQIRGLLCSSCNLKLGFIERELSLEWIKYVEAATSYLGKYKSGTNYPS